MGVSVAQIEQFMTYTAAIVQSQGGCDHESFAVANIARDDVGLPAFICDPNDPVYLANDFGCSCDLLFRFPEFLALLLNHFAEKLTAEEQLAIRQMMLKEQALERFEGA